MIYEYEGHTYTVEITPLEDDTFRVTLGDEVFTVQARQMTDGGWLLQFEEQQSIAYSAAEGGARHVWVDGEAFTLTVPETRSRRRSAATSAGDLTAQMPGQVRAVLVAEGDSVEAGQTLIILEAMKMELRVSAPGAGHIRRVLVAAGEVVERGQRLIELAD